MGTTPNRTEDFTNKVNGNSELVGSLKTLHYPSLTGSEWTTELHVWMQEVLDAFLGFHVDVPKPPVLNQYQCELLTHFGFKLFFVPAIVESRYPSHMIRFDYQHLPGVDTQLLPLPDRWVAFEVIKKPNFMGSYPNDPITPHFDGISRFGLVYLDGDEHDGGLVGYLLPKIAKMLSPLGGAVKIQSARIFNFIGNLFNWLTANTADTLPNLGSTSSVEWCEEHYGLNAIVVGFGMFNCNGLSYIHSERRDRCSGHIAFRFIIEFEAVKVAA